MTAAAPHRGWPRRAVAVVLATGLTAGIAALSRVPYTADPGADGALRLSWRAIAARVEECRPLTDAERDRLPAHMRRDEVCEGRYVPYALHVRLDGASLIRATIRPAGARGDRPMFVYREIRLSPGRYRLEVDFSPEDAAALETAESGRATPPLRLDAHVEVRAGDVVLVTYEAERRELVVRAPEARDGASTGPSGGSRGGAGGLDDAGWLSAARQPDAALRYGSGTAVAVQASPSTLVRMAPVPTARKRPATNSTSK